MNATRHQICESASRKLSAAAASLPRTKALIGLDGFVDEIIEPRQTRERLAGALRTHVRTGP